MATMHPMTQLQWPIQMAALPAVQPQFALQQQQQQQGNGNNGNGNGNGNHLGDPQLQGQDPSQQPQQQGQELQQLNELQHQQMGMKFALPTGIPNTGLVMPMASLGLVPSINMNNNTANVSVVEDSPTASVEQQAHQEQEQEQEQQGRKLVDANGHAEQQQNETTNDDNINNHDEGK